MTNRSALIFGGFLLALLAIDWLFANGFATTFLARKFIELVDWVAFWR